MTVGLGRVGLSIFQFYFQSNRHLDFGVSDFKLLVGSLGQTCCGTEGCTTTAWCISDRRPNWGRNWPSSHHHFQFEFMSRLRDIRPDFVHGEDAVIFEEDIAYLVRRLIMTSHILVHCFFPFILFLDLCVFSSSSSFLSLLAVSQRVLTLPSSSRMMPDSQAHRFWPDYKARSASGCKGIE